jgi:hypothetical protein
MKTEYNHRLPFDSPAWDALLQQLERAAPEDVAAWRRAEAAEFAANTGISRGLPDKALMQRLFARLAAIIGSDDKYAGPIAFSGLRGHVLRPLLLGDTGLLPEEARGRILLTDPRTATDGELARLLASYRDARPDHYAAWRATRIAVEKYRLVNGADAPLTAALDEAVGRSMAALGEFVMARCWVRGGVAYTTASSLLDDLLMAGITAEELAVGPGEEALRITLPSDEDVLAWLEGYDQAPDARAFTVTTRNALELRALLDLTEEVMAAARKSNWDARATARSGDAGHHAACFRMMKELHEAVRAAWETARAPRQ